MWLSSMRSTRSRSLSGPVEAHSEGKPRGRGVPAGARIFYLSLSVGYGVLLSRKLRISSDTLLVRVKRGIVGRVGCSEQCFRGVMLRKGGQQLIVGADYLLRDAITCLRQVGLRLAHLRTCDRDAAGALAAIEERDTERKQNISAVMVDGRGRPAVRADRAHVLEYVGTEPDRRAVSTLRGFHRRFRSIHFPQRSNDIGPMCQGCVDCRRDTLIGRRGRRCVRSVTHFQWRGGRNAERGDQVGHGCALGALGCS